MLDSRHIYYIGAEKFDGTKQSNFDFGLYTTSRFYVSRANIDNPKSYHLVTYWALSPDGCSVLGIPDVKLVRKPVHGSVRIVQPSPIDAECNDRPIMLEGSAVYYKPDIGFVGADWFELTVAVPPYWVPEPRRFKVELIRREG